MLSDPRILVLTLAMVLCLGVGWYWSLFAVEASLRSRIPGRAARVIAGLLYPCLVLAGAAAGVFMNWTSYSGSTLEPTVVWLVGLGLACLLVPERIGRILTASRRKRAPNPEAGEACRSRPSDLASIALAAVCAGGWFISLRVWHSTGNDNTQPRIVQPGNSIHVAVGTLATRHGVYTVLPDDVLIESAYASRLGDTRSTPEAWWPLIRGSVYHEIRRLDDPPEVSEVSIRVPVAIPDDMMGPLRLSLSCKVKVNLHTDSAHEDATEIVDGHASFLLHDEREYWLDLAARWAVHILGFCAVGAFLFVR